MTAVEDIRPDDDPYRLITRLMSDYVFRLAVADDGSVTMDMVSENFQRDTGRTAEESRTPELWANIVHPEDIENVRTLLQQLITKGSAAEIECRSFLKDSRMRWVHVAARAIKDPQSGRTQAIVGMVKDITDRKKAEEALRESEHKLRNLADNLPNAMVYQLTAEPDGGRRFTHVSRSVERLNGLPVEELMANASLIYEQILPEYRELVREREEDALNNFKTMHVEVLSRLPDGRLRWFEYASTPRYLPDGSLVWDGVEVDITDRKLAEEDLERRVAQRTAELTEANSRLQSEIDERIQTEKQLQDTEDRYRSLYVHSRDAIMILSPERGFIAANPATVKLYACRDEADFITHTPESLSPEYQPDGILSTVKAGQMKQLALENGSHYFEWTHRRVDGTEFPAVVLLSRFEHHGKSLLMATVRDISAHIRAEQLLRESEERYRALFDQAADGVVFYCLEDGTRVVNESFVRMHGYDNAKEMERLGLGELDTPESAALAPERLRRLEDGEPLVFEVEHYRKDGSRIPLQVSAKLIKTGGKRYYLGFHHDLTQQKRAEEERHRLEAQVQHAQKLESLGVLAGGLAHDFNNILQLILGNAFHMQKVVNELSPARPFVDNIERAANRAAALTRQMLAYAGKGHFLPHPVDLGETVGDIAHLIRSSLSKKISLQVNVEKELPAIEADPAQVQQVAMNLILNAAEALDAENGGCVTVSAAARHCTEEDLRETRALFNASEGDYVCLTVSDNGCGMDEQTRARLFDPFFTTKFTGRGLGMSAVLGIVRAHKGAILVEGSPGTGTTMRVFLPAIARPAPKPAQVPFTPPPDSPPAKGTILCVDDEPDMLDLNVLALGQMGYRVLAATDGIEAVNLLQEHTADVDCVLLDLNMPRMDGAQTLLELRRIKPDVRVILASGYAERELHARLAGQKVDAFIEKPYYMKTLSAILHDLLG